jgi:hypothetical protein
MAGLREASFARCSGHPRLAVDVEGVDTRDKPAHDD